MVPTESWVNNQRLDPVRANSRKQRSGKSGLQLQYKRRFFTHLFVKSPIHGKVFGAQVWAHVGFHQVQVEVCIQHEVEADELEEAAPEVHKTS